MFDFEKIWKKFVRSILRRNSYDGIMRAHQRTVSDLEAIKEERQETLEMLNDARAATIQEISKTTKALNTFTKMFG